MTRSLLLLFLLGLGATLVQCKLRGRGHKFRSVPDNQQHQPGGDNHGGPCGPVPSSSCAVLYSDEFCGGRSWALLENNRDREIDSWLWRNDVESVSVKAGCTLEGHEFENGRGRGISISAGHVDHHVEDLEQYEHLLDEDMRSVACRCDPDPTRPGYDQPVVRAVGGADCPAVPDTACAVVYSKENCKGMRQEVTPGTSDRYLSTWLSHEEPESVSVAAGCTFTAWESAGRRGRSVAVVGGGGEGKHVTDLEMYMRQHGVRDEVESFQCFCDRGPYRDGTGGDF